MLKMKILRALESGHARFELNLLDAIYLSRSHTPEEVAEMTAALRELEADGLIEMVASEARH
jgi:hypothetical protein